MLKKLAAYQRQNQLDLALQELGRIERTLFMFDWLESPQLRQRCHAGLNKSEQRHALAQVVCTFKQGRIADRGQEAQQFRASGLNLVIAAIVYWNSTYIADAVAHLRAQGAGAGRAARPHLAADLGAHRLLRRRLVHPSRCLSDSRRYALDLLDLVAWIAAENPESGSGPLRRLRAQPRSLGRHPAGRPPLRFRKPAAHRHAGPPGSSLPEGSDLLPACFLELVEIIRILHGSRDIPAILEEEP